MEKLMPTSQSAFDAANTAISKSWEFSIVTGIETTIIGILLFFLVAMFRSWRVEASKRDEREERDMAIREKEITAKENLAIALTKLAEKVGGFKCLHG